MLEEAYQEAQKYQPIKAGQLKHNAADVGYLLTGDRSSLKHAFIEVMLNALQANPSSPRITVTAQPQTGDNGTDLVQIEFRDNGTGFTAESAVRAFEPFYTTRNVGLGLGLVVSRKVAESHHGKLDITAPKAAEGGGIVRFSLPLAEPIPGEGSVGEVESRSVEIQQKVRGS
jgi:signal transduction histidine kinase